MPLRSGILGGGNLGFPGGDNLRVSRSLTIKQMAMVAAVVLVFVFIFCTVLLFHLVQQNRYNTATQLESIARSVREPLSSAILKGDIPEAEAILASIKPAGVVSRADVVLPNQFQALRKSFINNQADGNGGSRCPGVRFYFLHRFAVPSGPAESL